MGEELGALLRRRLPSNFGHQQRKMLVTTLAKVLQNSQVFPMTEALRRRYWATDAVSNAVNSYYRYQVKVCHPTTGNVETRLVTDPYSLSLSKNSAYSQVIDLNDAAVIPEGWVGYWRWR
ncbi:hypothetical protein O9929_12485 [Vibrio lentus]|nr:hypothetical protein [Vibrio lentus]